MLYEAVWQTTADVLPEYYFAHYYDQAMVHALKFNAVIG
jgi:hypothetical protein